MASGFSGGGPDFYNIAGRSINNTANNNTNNIINSNGHHPAQNLYRNQQLSQIFLDRQNQIAQRGQFSGSVMSSQSLIGKRTLADFQRQSLNPVLNNLLLRSVKPRMFQNNPMEFATGNNFSPDLPSISQRYGLPLLQQQQLRPNRMNLCNEGPTFNMTAMGNNNNNNNNNNNALNYMNAIQNPTRVATVTGEETEKKMMNRLQELEKQLLDDIDEENDAVSVITNTNSEWSETIQSLIGPNPNPNPSPSPISPSPTSSSSSSSSSVTAPVFNCTKEVIMEAAKAIYEGTNEVAADILARVCHVPNGKGSYEQRLMDFMVLALKSRIQGSANTHPVTELFSKEHTESTQSLYELSPCFKLGFMAANLAIVEAALDENNKSNSFHVIDFDGCQEGQYMNLLHVLSERKSEKPIHVKITVVADNGGEERERLAKVGDKLSQLAQRCGVTLAFNVVSCKLVNLTRETLGCGCDEALAVNFAFKLFQMPDESVTTENPRDELLRRVKGLSPRVVTLVEQEMNINTAPLLTRVKETYEYFRSLLESIDSTVQRENPERVKAEEGLKRKLINSVACEGRDRVERCEVYGKWRARMSMANYKSIPLSQNVAEAMKARLSSASRVNPGFTVVEENGGVYFGWMGKTLTIASAWR